MTSNREYTAIDRIADAHHDASVALSPISATYLGVPGADDRLDDFSPAGLEHTCQLAADALVEHDGSVVDLRIDAARERIRAALGQES